MFYYILFSNKDVIEINVGYTYLLSVEYAIGIWNFFDLLKHLILSEYNLIFLFLGVVKLVKIKMELIENNITFKTEVLTIKIFNF